jgi:hypothetical protein
MDFQAGQWLKTLAETGLGWVTVNRVRAILPLLIMQSDKAAEALKKANGRLAEIKAFEQMVRNEVETRNATRRALIERITTASPEEHIEIEQKLEWLDGVTRQLNISLRALSYGEKEPDPARSDEKEPFQDHWIDRFNDVARRRNEEWRTELLARVLAKEVAAPGSISTRALWLVGTLEKHLFDAFSALLDVCVWFESTPDPGPFIPNSHVQAINQPTEMLVRGHTAYVGELHNTIADIGLVSNPITSRKTIHRDSEFMVRHGSTGFRIKLKSELVIAGLLLTDLGNSLASFHHPKWNLNGVRVLEGWIVSLPRATVDVSPIDQSELN